MASSINVMVASQMTPTTISPADRAPGLAQAWGKLMATLAEISGSLVGLQTAQDQTLLKISNQLNYVTGMLKTLIQKADQDQDIAAIAGGIAGAATTVCMISMAVPALMAGEGLVRAGSKTIPIGQILPQLAAATAYLVQATVAIEMGGVNKARSLIGSAISVLQGVNQTINQVSKAEQTAATHVTETGSSLNSTMNKAMGR